VRRAIAPAQGGDVACMRSIRRAAIEAVPADALDARRRAAWLALDDGAMQRAAAAGDGVLVARTEQAIDGFAWVAMDERPHLFALYVHPDAAGRGVGTALLAAAENHARARGARELFVAASPAAVGFYVHRGYRAEQRFDLACRDAAGPLALPMRKMSKRLDDQAVLPSA
jgi:putative acetyltransferase